jgi:hypothetical protein
VLKTGGHIWSLIVSYSEPSLDLRGADMYLEEKELKQIAIRQATPERMEKRLSAMD